MSFKQIAAVLVGGLTALQLCGAQMARASGEMQPKAVDVLNKAADFYGGLSSVRGRLRLTTHIQSGDSTSDILTSYDMGMQRPNKFALILLHGFSQGTAVTNGAKAIFYQPHSNRIVEEPAADSLASFFQNQSLLAVSEGILRSSTLDLLLVDHPKEAIQKSLKNASYVGAEKIGSTMCNHIKTDVGLGTEELWFSQGAQPWLLRVIPTITLSEATRRSAEAHQLKIKQTIEVRDMKPNAKVDDLLAYTVPDEALKAASFASGGTAVDEQAVSHPDATPENRQQAKDIMLKVADFYGKLEGMSFGILCGTNVGNDKGMKSNYTSYDFAAQRPNKLAIIEKSGVPAQDEVSDGTDLVVYDPVFNKYVVSKAAPSFQKLMIDPQFHTGFSSLKGSFLFTLLSDNPTKSLVPPTADMIYEGKDQLGDIQVDRIRMQTSNGVKEYVYVDSGPQPWIRQVVINLSSANPFLQLVTRYKNPVANPTLAANQFKFSAPEGAVKTDSIYPKPPEHPLTGKPAPDFTIDILGGNQLQLSSLRGKKIVMLDFWATWCGPCRAAMPQVIKVADQYKDKGVAFYAVNEQEDAGRINTFLKNNNYTFDVALDKDGRIGQNFGVTGIPQTVIIDRGGTIRMVHIGSTPDIDTELSEELDKILASGSQPSGAGKKTEGTKDSAKPAGKSSGSQTSHSHSTKKPSPHK
jgi:peroxiredoxin